MKKLKEEIKYVLTEYQFFVVRPRTFHLAYSFDMRLSHNNNQLFNYSRNVLVRNTNAINYAALTLTTFVHCPVIACYHAVNIVANKHVIKGDANPAGEPVSFIYNVYLILL